MTTRGDYDDMGNIQHPAMRSQVFFLVVTVALSAPLPLSTSYAQANPAAPALPMCSASQLSLGTDGENGNFNGMSHSGTLLVLRNLGSNACRVDAIPQLTFADATHDLPARAEMQGARFMHPGPVVLPVVIAPGAELTATLRWVSGEVYAKSVCIKPTRLTLKIGQDSQAVAIAAHLCGDATQSGATYQMTRFAPDPVYDPATRSPRR